MYQITRDGKTLAMTEAPNYIRRAENGCFTLCKEAEATGIAIAGKAYHILGRPDMEGAAATVMLEETDAGGEIHAAKLAAEDADGMIVDQEYRLTLLELGLTDET
mgnify:CR=1 FL=1|jgi:hypothetical protein